MRLQVLGPLSVSLPGRTVDLRGQRPRDVLAVLVQRRGYAVPAEVLLDTVWGAEAGPLTTATVHTVVARVRRALGTTAVLTDGLGYRLGRADVDEDEFEARCATARDASARGRLVEATESYRIAVGMWRGDTAYAGVSDDLAGVARARLAESRSRAVEELCSLLLGQQDRGSAQEAHDLAAAMVRAHPLRELPYAHLMHAEYRLGRQAEALAVYRDLRRRLREDLGIDPSARVEQLHRQVLAQDPGLDRTDPAPETSLPPRGARARAARVPVPLTTTVGRDAEIGSVLAAVEQGRRLVTLVGPGGVGKSRLLAEIGARLAASTPVSYLDLAGLGEVGVDGLADAAAVALGLGSSDRAPVDGLVAGLARREDVVLVDEAEWAVDAVGAVVSEVLGRCPGVRFVVTSRVPLRVVGERQVVVGPLACPPVRTSGRDVLAAPAARLLAERLADHGTGEDFEDDQLDLLGRIARRVDGLPLALEIVAGHAGTHTLDELVALLDLPLDVVAVERHHSPRHRSLRDTIGWSVDRLAPAARAVLFRLGVFAGSIDPAAAAAVAAPVRPAPGATVAHAAVELDARQVDSTVRSLAREGLLHVDREGPRLTFRMLRTIRDLALEGLDESGERAVCTARMRRWYAERWRGQPRSDALIDDVQRHYDDYLAALREALPVDPGAAVDLALTLTRFWLFGSLRGIGVRWTTRVLAAPGVEGIDRARVLLARGMLDKTDPDRSYADLIEAIPALEQSGDPPFLVSAYMAVALHETHRGRSEPAVAAARRAVDVGRMTDGERLADALGVLAVVQGDVPDEVGTLATVEEALGLLRSTRSRAARVAVTSNLAHSLLNVGHPRQALSLVEGVLEIAGGVGGAATVDFLLETAGWAALACGQPHRALGLYADVLAALGAEAGLSQYGISAALGAACALVQIGDPTAGRAMEIAVRRLHASGFAVPPMIRGPLGRAETLLRATTEPTTPAIDGSQPDEGTWLLAAVTHAAHAVDPAGLTATPSADPAG